MQALQLNHPWPSLSPPEGLDPDSVDSVRRFVSRRSFPSAKDGRFLFAYVDEEQRFEVWLRHKLAGHRQLQKFFRCAGGIHLLQMDAPAVNRVEYSFKLIDGEGAASFALDPLNPASVRDPFSSESVIATPEYRSPAYVDDPPSEARGTLEEIVIEGPLGKPWPTWIWSPPLIAHSDALPVIVFLDGSDWLQLAGARNILENLVHTRAIRPCRAVFMKPASRNEEYATNPRTAAFLHNDLPRALGEHIPWPAKQRERIAVGVSLGALCLIHAHFTQAPHVPFGGLVLQSGSFFQPHSDVMETGYPHFQRICEFVSHACSHPLNDVARITIHVTCGAGEENIINNRAMAHALREHGFPITFHEQPDAHNWTCWRDSVGEGLKRLLRP